MEKKPFERPFIKKLQAGMPSKFGMKSQVEPITHIDDIPVPGTDGRIMDHRSM